MQAIVLFFQAFGRKMNGGHWDWPSLYYGPDTTERLGVDVYGVPGANGVMGNTPATYA